MNFTISEEQQSAQQLAQQILSEFSAAKRAMEEQNVELARMLVALEETEERRRVELKAAKELGFYSLTTLCEEVGRTVAPVPIIPVLVSAAGTLKRFASDIQKDQWLPGIANGTTLISAALEEYNNDDPTTPACSAQKMEGGYSISGTKICVSEATSATRILLSAHTGDELVVALVDPRAAGVTLNPQLVTTGETRHELIMAKVQVPSEDIIAIGSEALAAMDWAHTATRTALAAMAVGLCDKMMRITGQYTSEREQFGRPIATFQAVSHRVADCYIDVECLRLVAQQAASLISEGHPAREAAQIAKIWCGNVTHRVSQASQHCHGGTGVDRDYLLFRYCEWARQTELTSGSSAQLSGELGQSISAEYLSKVG